MASSLPPVQRMENIIPLNVIKMDLRAVVLVFAEENQFNSQMFIFGVMWHFGELD